MSKKKKSPQAMAQPATQPIVNTAPIVQPIGQPRTRTNTSIQDRARGFLAQQANTIRKTLLGE
jgi:hypothetical protein